MKNQAENQNYQIAVKKATQHIVVQAHAAPIAIEELGKFGDVSTRVHPQIGIAEVTVVCKYPSLYDVLMFLRNYKATDQQLADLQTLKTAELCQK